MHPSIVLSDATRNADKLWAAVVEKSLGHRRGFIEAQLPEFIEWKKGLERIGSFWTGEDQIAVIGAHRGKEPVGLIRMLRVPILPWEIHVWGREEKFRAELQDIAIVHEHAESDVGCRLIERAVQAARSSGLAFFGGSTWVKEQQAYYEQAGFRRYARAEMVRRPLDEPLPPKKQLPSGMRLVELKKSDSKVVEDVFEQNWGYRLKPDFKLEQPIAVMDGGKAAGLVLVNKVSGNLDFGVQVLNKYRRFGLGTILMRSACEAVQKIGRQNTWIVRAVGAHKATEQDRIALKFFKSVGAVVHREIVGFKLPVPGMPPDLW
jgi:predicted N-acetyltransferase YhbS